MPPRSPAWTSVWGWEVSWGRTLGPDSTRQGMGDRPGLEGGPIVGPSWSEAWESYRSACDADGEAEDQREGGICSKSPSEL